MNKTVSIAVLILAAGATYAATITSQTATPSVGLNDIAQLVSPGSDTENIGGTGITYSGDNDANTYVANDRTTQGQLFTTGSQPGGYLLNSLWVRHVGYTNFLDNGTWASFGDGSQVTLRIVDPAQAGASGFVVHSETATVASGSGFSGGDNTWNGTGKWLEITLDSPVVLGSSKQYGFDLTSYGPWFELAGMDANQYAGGSAYTTIGKGDLNTGTVHAGDRTFVVNLSTLTVPSLSIASVSNNLATLVWPFSEPEFLLMQSTNLAEGEWDYAGVAQDAGNGTNFVASMIDANAKFFRLMQSSGEHLIPVVSVQQDADGATLIMDPGTMKLQVFSPTVIRVAYSLTNAIPTNSLAVIAPPTNSGWTLTENALDIRLATSALEVRVDRGSGAVGFYDTNGVPLLKEQTGGGKTLTATTVAGINTLQSRETFELAPDEAIYGLGQQQAGVMNRRGTSVHLQQLNTEVAVPVMISSGGYGIFWDNPAITDVDVGQASSNKLSWTSEASHAMDYYFMYGPKLDDVIAGYRNLTGTVPMFGKWAWGLWQCKNAYSSQQELLDVVGTYRTDNIPLDCIIQDWQWWWNNSNTSQGNAWGSHIFYAPDYPNPTNLMTTLHAENTHAIISVWPRFDVGIEHANELDAVGGLFTNVLVNVWPPGQGRWYDPFNAAARQVYWSQMSEHIFSTGFDGWWFDASEPELSGNWGEFRNYSTAAGPGAEVFNAYPLMHTTTAYEGQRAETSDKRVFILTRAAWAGQQRNAAVTWSGDIGSSFSVLANQIPAGLNFCATGIPYWNTDTGGFNDSNVNNSSYAEVFTRWFQYSCFCPMLRIHGNNYKEIWRWPTATQNILIDFDKLRYHLVPYIYSVSWMVTSDGYTMMRPLVMDFRTDSNVYDIDDQFMFGPAVMACPVTTASATSRNVYLPAGTSWYDFWTGSSYAGGQTISASAPIEKMPLFVRAGSILPYGPDIQYATESVDPMEIRVYRGTDGSFTLYEDENDNYNYESGSYATIPFTWDESAQTLTIGARQGSFPGMLSNRTFRVVWVDAGQGAGIPSTTTADEIVNYTGAEVVVSAP